MRIFKRNVIHGINSDTFRNWCGSLIPSQHPVTKLAHEVTCPKCQKIYNQYIHSKKALGK